MDLLGGPVRRSAGRGSEGFELLQEQQWQVSSASVSSVAMANVTAFPTQSQTSEQKKDKCNRVLLGCTAK